MRGWTLPLLCAALQQGALAGEGTLAGAEWIRPAEITQGAAFRLRCEFDCPSSVTQATLTAATAGFGVWSINGRRVGDALYEPIITYFEHGLFSRAYDVTELVGVGAANRLEVEVGGGWWDQTAVWASENRGRGCAYGRPAARAALELRFRDGTVRRVATAADGAWRSVGSPIVWNNVYGGEIYDARVHETSGTVVVADEIKVPIRPCELPPSRVLSLRRPVSVRSPFAGRLDSFVYDFGTNIAGTVVFHFPPLVPGSKVKVRLAETTTTEGFLDPRSEGAFATHLQPEYVFIAPESPQAMTWRPEFSYTSFRYAEVSGVEPYPERPAQWGQPPPEGFLEAAMVATDLQTVGSFSCSHEQTMRLIDLVQHTYRCNFHGIPEDCPGREKCGWLGDGQLMSAYALETWDVADLYRKYAEDIVSGTEISGIIPQLVPSYRSFDWGMAPALWRGAAVVVPYNLYLHCGDAETPRKCWATIERCLKAFADEADEKMIVRKGYGDWCPPPNSNESPTRMPVAHSSTLAWIEYARMADRLARELKLPAAEDYARRAEAVKQAFVREFYNSRSHTYGYDGTDAAAYSLGVHPDGEGDALLAALVARVRRRGMMMTTGIYSSPFFAHALVAGGHGDLLASVLFNPKQVSYRTVMDSGHTTLPENLQDPMHVAHDGQSIGSYSHPMHGAVLRFLAEDVAGVRPLEAGYRRFAADPRPSRTYGDFSAVVPTPQGAINLTCRPAADGFAVELTVPDGTECEFGPSRERLGPGRHVRTIPRSDDEKPDVFIGTSGDGHCSPAAAWPFGMVMAGPDTYSLTNTVDCRQSGYQYGDEFVCRFSQLHVNGTGCPSLGNLGLLPRIAPAPEGELRSPMDKASERGEPGYYAVRLADSDVLCEMTVGAHTAAYRFGFPKGARRFLIVDGDWGVAASSERPEPIGRQYIHATAMDFPANDAVAGFVRVTSWTDYSVYWNIAFSQPVIARRKLTPGHGGRGETWELEFASGEEPLEVRMGLSSVSGKGAAHNLAAEMPRFAFDRQRAAADAAWSGVLSRVRLGANVDPVVAANFRSALYRLFVQPSDIGDVGAQPSYSTLSLWDTYRAAHPLYTILTPERVDGFVESMLRQYRRQGYLPIWGLMGNETHCMIGHHAVPVIVDAYLKGFRGFDVETAYEAVTNSLTVSHRSVNNGTWGLMKEDWPVYNRLGYVPFDGMEESSGGRRVTGESVSRTLECAYDDACAARFAAALGRKKDEAFFAHRAANWKNVFDPEIGFVRGRDLTGRWRTPFDPYDIGHCWWSNSDFTEGNAWQWTWHVMQDPDGLVSALGGPAKFGAKLDELFTTDSRKQSSSDTFMADVTGLIGQYAHGNEPGHHTAYFFRWSDRPARTEELVRTICDTQYAPRPDGLCGNDDCGQMAAWYVFSALGFYPFDPCGGTYVIGAPQLAEAALSLPGGRTLKITARNLSFANCHVKAVTLNGRPLADHRITHAEILAGGELVYEMMP